MKCCKKDRKQNKAKTGSEASPTQRLGDMFRGTRREQGGLGNDHLIVERSRTTDLRSLYAGQAGRHLCALCL